jgi:hypothetical protein
LRYGGQPSLAFASEGWTLANAVSPTRAAVQRKPPAEAPGGFSFLRFWTVTAAFLAYLSGKNVRSPDLFGMLA